MPMSELVLWFTGVLIALIAATVLLLRLRAWIGEGTRESKEPSFSLPDLRRRRDQGRLTIAEYEALKEVVVREAKTGSIQTNETAPDKVL